jgi:hypothetical protein
MQAIKNPRDLVSILTLLSVLVLSARHRLAGCEVGSRQPAGALRLELHRPVLRVEGRPLQRHDRPRDRADRLRAQRVGADPRRNRQPDHAAVREPRLQQSVRRHPGIPRPAGAPGPQLRPPRRKPALGDHPAHAHRARPERRRLPAHRPDPGPATFGAAHFNSMDLADNQLAGDPSLLFGAGKKINALRLSRNRFRFDFGRIDLPEPFDILVIDHNLVYGAIPPAAAARTRKWLAFDVSFNQLCGPIPQGRLTRRFGPRHFAGNKCLCGRPLPPCS